MVKIKDTLTIKDLKDAISSLEKSATKMEDFDYFLVFPERYKSYEKELKEQVVKMYPGTKILVLFNAQIKW